MSFSPNINVWTLGKGPRGAWKLQHTTESLEEAVTWFEQLEAKGKQVALYELGAFLHEGKQTAGQVAFWWSVDLNAYMERAPEGRGIGWADGFDTWITYAFPEPSVALPTPREASLPETIAEPEERYVEAACEHCGRILPMNRLKRLTHEVRAGRSSGSFRSSRSTTSRTSSKSLSNSSTFGTSSSSGRSYYKTETLVLCEACHEKQVYADRTITQILFERFMRALR